MTPEAGGRYEVLAIRYATLSSTRRELYHRWESYGEPDGGIEMAYYFWVLRSAAETILVDTGFDPAAGARRGRTMLRDPVEALRDAGVDPSEVTTVIVTHFHYDHIGNLGAYPGAALIVPRRELEFWSGPLAGRRQFASHVEAAEIAAVAQAQQAGRVRLTEGTEELFSGITSHDVGGHSPGQLVLVVAAAGGEVVLTSDAVHFYEELELDRPFGVIVELPAMYEGYDLLRRLAAPAGAVLVPGHDPDVLTRFPVAGGDGNVVRLA